MKHWLPVAILFAACGGSSPRTQNLLQPAVPLAMPAGVERCALLGVTEGGRTCAYYDTKAKAFAPQGDGSPEDTLARRAFQYERWFDLYNGPEKQSVVRVLTESMPPETPESKFGDEQYLARWDDQGDSTGFGEEAVRAALFKYLTTGAEADRLRLEAWVRGQVMKFEATGMDGYASRWHFAGVPPGTKIRDGVAMDFRTDGDDSFDVPAAALDQMPAYYRTGLDVGGTHLPVRPSWAGHVSIDAYSGPMNSFPLAYDFIKDKDLKARMARHYGCFLKRLRIFKVINLSKNAQLQKDISSYLVNGVLLKDADDPDLTKIDEIWGFYLPQFNNKSAATFQTGCPAELATDAIPTEIVDAAVPGFTDRLLLIMLRQLGSDQSDSMDFAFYPSVRAGDAVMLDAYAIGAYHLTGDQAFLRWRDNVLFGKAKAKEVERTVGAFNPPKACRTYYRTPNVYFSHYMRTMLDRDPESQAFAQLVMEKKFAGREVAGLKDDLFEILFSGASGKKSAGLADALADLTVFGGSPAKLDSPRRNYSVDLVSNPLPGIKVAKATQAELDICNQPITVLGFTFKPDPADPNELFTDVAVPASKRPPDNWQWEKTPFRAVRINGDAGYQQYPGTDFIEPYWEARYYGYLPDPHLALAWR